MNKRILLTAMLAVCLCSNFTMDAVTLNSGESSNPVARFFKGIYRLGVVSAALLVSSFKTKPKYEYFNFFESMDSIFINISCSVSELQKKNLLRFIAKAKEVAIVHQENFAYNQLLHSNKISRDLTLENKFQAQYDSKYKELDILIEAFKLKQQIIQEGQRHYRKVAVPKIEDYSNYQEWSNRVELPKIDYSVDQYFDRYSKMLIKNLRVNGLASKLSALEKRIESIF